MMYYHCTERDCEKTFKTDGARYCPCCGGRELRHALGREIDEYEKAQGERVQLIPVYAMGA